MTPTSLDSFKSRKTLKVGSKNYTYFSLKAAEKNGLKGISKLPYSLKVLLENLLRHEDGRSVTKAHIEGVADWLKNRGRDEMEIAFRPARVLMQDFTGVPAVVDLAAMRESLDPRHEEPALDQMVLIGHSMGGLVSRMQTMQSGDDYWKLVSNEPLAQIKTDPDTRQKLQATFYFQPNPSIRQVVTIGTPHHGSPFSSQTAQWLLGKLIDMPKTIVNGQQKLYLENQGAFPSQSLLRVDTSIDSLAPNEPIFPVMQASRRAPWVRYHNIVGVVPEQWWLSTLAGDGDGVVPRASAHVDDAVSEIAVPADHTTVHAHPAAVLEVRRILFEHLADLEGRSAEDLALRSSQ